MAAFGCPPRQWIRILFGLLLALSLHNALAYNLYHLSRGAC